jgi:hypothetical protein
MPVSGATPSVSHFKVLEAVRGTASTRGSTRAASAGKKAEATDQQHLFDATTMSDVGEDESSDEDVEVPALRKKRRRMSGGDGGGDDDQQRPHPSSAETAPGPNARDFVKLDAWPGVLYAKPDLARLASSVPSNNDGDVDDDCASEASGSSAKDAVVPKT